MKMNGLVTDRKCTYSGWRYIFVFCNDVKVGKLSKFTEELLPFLYVFGNLEGNFFVVVYNNGSFYLIKTSLVEIA